jgi:hypothetical protein
VSNGNPEAGDKPVSAIRQEGRAPVTYVPAALLPFVPAIVSMSSQPDTSIWARAGARPRAFGAMGARVGRCRLRVDTVLRSPGCDDVM